MDKQKFGINEKEMDKSTVLKLINIRYQIWLNSYQKYISTTIAEDVSDATVADIMENLDKLSGINVEEESLRKYADSKCFANIIGYTGQISQEEYDALSDADQERYSKTDTVGKAGLEKAMDSQLQGKKGSEKLYVNNVGKVIKTVKGTNPKAGNDLYLTIDANLQKAAYNILEQELAGVLLAKIQNSLDFDRNKVEDGSDVIIPIGDVYNAMINNDVLDMTHFTDPDAGEAEKEVASAFSIRKEEVKNTLTKVLNDSKAAAYKNQPEEVQAYLTYLVSDVLTNGTGVLMSKSIDTKDATYKAWKDEESINVYTYLNYAISKNWIDTSLLKDYIKSNEQYSDSGEVYQGIINYILDYINTDNNFDKLIYRYMIKSGTITGRQICMMLYEQNILDKKDNQYDSLKAGSIGAYDFIRSKAIDQNTFQRIFQPAAIQHRGIFDIFDQLGRFTKSIPPTAGIYIKIGPSQSQRVYPAIQLFQKLPGFLQISVSAQPFYYKGLPLKLQSTFSIALRRSQTYTYDMFTAAFSCLRGNHCSTSFSKKLVPDDISF